MTKEIENDLGNLMDLSDLQALYKIADIFKILEVEVLDVYNSNPPINVLEEIKIELAGQLVYLAKLYGAVKKYKGSNHTYLEDARKQLKAICFDKMPGNVTQKKESIYNYPEFVRRNNSLIKMKQQFVTIEEIYESYQRLFQSIQQSISVETKSFQGAQAV